MKLQQRIPRPLGITMLMRERKLKEATNVLLTHWVTNNFTISGDTYSIPQVAQMLKTTPALIIKSVTKPLKTWLLTEKPEEAYGVLISLLINFALSDRQQTQGQLALLLSDQAGHYKPFLSSTVGHAITNLLQSTKGFSDIVKQFKPEMAASPSLTTGLTPPTGATQGSKFLGTVEAMKLIEANRNENLLERGTLQDKILEKENLKELPEVIATKQQGLDSSGLSKHPKKRKHNTDPDPNIKDAVIIP